ncbi:MAG: cyclic pyranopterin monophosphate synthase MoaC [Candidatus Omnitrophota bacterium]|nr:cyclic pyranopterin monophosphate synthase MoaC [Candidatus Omnitrophota bacterium]
MKKTEMIDVGDKLKTKRLARAQAFVRLDKDIIQKIKDDLLPKGNVLENARVAAILSAKKTSDLIPLCHNIELEYAGVDFLLKEDGIEIKSLIRATGKTGVEMEAMAACSVAALTIYDMCKMFSKDIEIEKIILLEKSGGKSGTYKRQVQNE